MCYPVWPTSNYPRERNPNPIPRSQCKTVEEYIKYLDTVENLDSFEARVSSLPVVLQSNENFAKIIAAHPEVIIHIPQRYKNKKVFALVEELKNQAAIGTQKG